MIPVDHIVYGDYLLPMTGDVPYMESGAAAVKDGRVLEVGSYTVIAEKYFTESLLGGAGKAVLPGLINTHTHAAMVYFRGLADDLPLKEWLEEHIWPTESKWLSPEFIRDATELACVEMLRAGITTFCDMYFYEDITGEVVKEMGMRAALGSGVLDFPTSTTSGADDCLRNAEFLIEKWKGDGTVFPGIAAHSTFGCSPETLKRVRDLALRHGVLAQVHLSETRWEVEESRRKYGKSPVELLDDMGFFDARTLAAHCVWISDEEMDILARKGTGVSHCVKSNLKLASGIAPVPRMLERGVKVSLGTDGAASNNDLDIISEMSIVAKLHKAASGDPTAVDARTALTMATRWGAESLGIEGIGSIKEGNFADMIVMDLQKPHLTPLYSICSQLVYSARSSDVETVMVNGRVLVEGGKVAIADEEGILEKARHWGKRIREDRS